MKKSKIALRLISLTLTFVLIFSVSGLSAFAADESDYVAEFRIETDKSTVKKGEDVEVDVYLKTDYYIFSLSLVVIYNCQAFTLQNTGSVASSFLTFSGQMADNYQTNGNWKNSEVLFATRNSRPAYWSREETLEKYKAVFATWAADSSYSYYLTMLEEEEKIVSFTLKANEDIEDLSELIFISMDFLKTAESPRGTLFVGRSTSEEINLNNVVSTGQTIIYKGVDPTVNEETEHTPGEAVTENLVLPDCENAGSYDTVVYCTFCGDEISRKTTKTEALGHKEGEIVTENEVSPDCVNEGSYDEAVYCTVCDKELFRETITVDALGHEYESVVTAPDCVNGGYTTFTCSVCGDVYTDEYTDALGHTLGRVEITEPTTEKEGLKVTFCDICDEVLSVEVIEKITLSIDSADGKDTVIDAENKIIYGLEVGAESLDDFVTVQGYTVEYTYFNGSFGTGTRVDCVYNGEIKETYYVVIFGDLTGDGVIDIYDSSVAAALVNGDMEFDEDSVFNLAADLNNDTASDIYDLAILNSVVNGETDLSQILK